MKIRERPPPLWEMSMVSLQGGDAGSRVRPPPILKMLMAGPLGGDAEDPGVPTTYVEDIDGRPPRRR
jgi:hypothetical protein